MLFTHNADSSLSLRGILPEAELIGGRDVAIASCSCDSRRVRRGNVFVAMVGREQDGHDFAADAIVQGAIAVVGERLLPLPGVPQYIVPDARIAYGTICHALQGHPAQALQLIGVTGAQGKTSTACLIGAMLESAGLSVGMLNSLGFCDGSDVEPARRTTPRPAELARWLSRMRDNGCTHAVVEVSTAALRNAEVAGIRFDTMSVNGLRTDTMYQRAREFLAPDGVAIVNADEPGAAAWIDRLDQPILTASLGGDAEISATLLERSRSEQTFLLCAGEDAVPVRTQIIGDGHIMNCLLAAAVGLSYGLDLMAVVRGLESVQQIPGRLERIECGQPFGVFVDHARRSRQLDSALHTVRDVTAGQLICVLARDLTTEMTTADVEMLRTAAAQSDQVVVAAGSDSTKLIRQMSMGALRSPLSAVRFVHDRGAAVAWALNEARHGDSVVFIGRDNDLEPTSLADVAREWLYRQAAFWTSLACA